MHRDVEHDKLKQGSVSHGKAAQVRARQCKPMQSIVNQCKEEQIKAVQARTRYCKSRQGSSNQCKAEQSKVRQCKSRQGSAGQGKTMQGKARQCKSGHDSACKGKTLQTKERQCKSGQGRASEGTVSHYVNLLLHRFIILYYFTCVLNHSTNIAAVVLCCSGQTWFQFREILSSCSLIKQRQSAYYTRKNPDLLEDVRIKWRKIANFLNADFQLSRCKNLQTFPKLTSGDIRHKCEEKVHWRIRLMMLLLYWG